MARGGVRPWHQGSAVTIPALLSDICTAIVGPHFRLGVHEGSETVLVEIFAASPYIGQLIGREGQMARALRDIATVAGWRQGLRVYVRVCEE